MTDNPPYLVKTGELAEDAAKLLFYSLPEDGWQSCSVVFREADKYAEFVAARTDSDGRTKPVAPSKALMDALVKLREAMAELGKGAWLEATLTVQRDPSTFAFDYNYDARPDWTVQPTAETYVEDLRKFPRAADQIPDWYPR